MSEKLCLKWNDFQENVDTAFGNLKGDKDFSDVTLACEDGEQFEAHKVILVASSPFFQHLLKINRHAHPLIFMRGVKSEELSAIIDFIYSGEANVFHENLESFLAIAEQLKLKGLMGQQSVKEKNHQEEYRGSFKQPEMEKEMKPIIKNNKNLPSSPKSVLKEEIEDTDFDHRASIPKVASAAESEEVYEQVRSMMEKSRNMIQNGITNGKAKLKRAFICKVCGKEGAKQAIVDHIELHHLEGVSLPCNSCQKTFRSRRNLRDHTSSNHRKATF